MPRPLNTPKVIQAGAPSHSSGAPKSSMGQQHKGIQSSPDHSRHARIDPLSATSDSAQTKLDPQGDPDTPPKTPSAQLPNPLEFRALVDAVKSLAPKDASGVSLPPIAANQSASEFIERASKLESKQVHEIWDPKAYAYTIVESPPTPEVTKLDAYVFVVRTRLPKPDEAISKPSIYIDIKSAGLRDILKEILKDIKWLSLGGDKPSVERNLLFHYLPELKDFRAKAKNTDAMDSRSLDALDLLIGNVEHSYQSTSERLSSQLQQGHIEYDLLWALFKSNDHVITTCSGSRKDKCLRFEMGEEKKTHQGVEYFELQCHYIDSDGSLIGSVIEKLTIERFRGVKPISSLSIFPLRFHKRSQDITESLAARGRKFMGLLNSHHQYYEGHAFFQQKKDLIRLHVKSRIMIDVKQFRKCNPNYPKIFTSKVQYVMDFFGEVREERQHTPRVADNGLDLRNMSVDQLLLCSPTLMGFSLNDKFWGEFAVDDIRPIDWSNDVLSFLALPSHTKEVIVASTQCRLARETTLSASDPALFDGVVEGRGRGIILLLHGPPGVGKTLTAETLAEHHHRPLYSVSVGELSNDAAELEQQLIDIFRTAVTWNALLLLDESDVFLQSRSLTSLERNRLVGVFLRQMETFAGVLFLTTNLIHNFDEAVLNRVHLKLGFHNLDKHARRSVLENLLRKISERQGEVDISKEYVDRFIAIQMNGREIKNILTLATDLAAAQSERLSSLHISRALKANNRSIPERAHSEDNSLYD
ncbi:hypothetical protein LTR05_006337 [Lithohypha guttulata]|uniref:AAA+ ATPase domain-containing protein n=1 Tax=Lithohypha guttulata TaxID=1690604 RepID=A0AAN7SXB9_9EURO|nr:hypothetical protein LTR05_006337 [Lithohypha guttulata]